MARSSVRTYDPATGTWVSSVIETADEVSNAQEVVKTQGNDNLTSNSTDSNSPEGSAEKEHNAIEYNILSGTLNFIANEKTIKLRAGDTVTLEGLGINLSGDYYVQDVTRSISASGYSHKATLIKTDFGSTLKTIVKSGVTPKETTKVESTARDSSDTNMYHTLKKGETLWGLAVKYYNDGSKYPKIADANNITPDQYSKLRAGTKLIIP